MNENLFETFRRHFPPDSSRPFLERPDGTALGYADLLDLTGRMAGALKGLGVGPGDRVAVQVEKSPEALVLYLATLRAGAVYLPLNTGYTAAEVRYFLGDAEPALFVCRPESAERMRPLAAEVGVPRVETLGERGDGGLMERVRQAGDGGGGADVPRARDDLAAILYTSGTTGRSKGAMLTHGNLASNAQALAETWGFTADDRLLHALPIFHTHGLFVATNVTLISGASLIFLPRFDPDEVIRLLPRATAMMGVPTFYTRLLARPDFTRDLVRHMRLFVSGSAPLLEETFRAFEERTGHRILERYGMTECGMNTSNPLHGQRRPGTVGPPLPGVEVRVADEGGNVLPPGETGVLEVRGPNVFKGYWRMPEKTAEEFRPDGFFITGDIARISEDGYVTIVGRSKDMIISGGFNVYPKEVEGVIDRIEGVDESAVIGVPHPDFGEGVVAVVKRREGAAHAVTADEVVAAARAELAGYKVPKRVVFVDELPRNTMGKVQKNLLRDAQRGAFEGAR